MPTAFLLDSDGRFVIQEDADGNKDFQMVEDIECIEQDMRIRLQTTLGEDVLHPEVGLPFDRIARGTNSYLEDRLRIAVELDDDIDHVTEVLSGSELEEDFPAEGGGRTRNIPTQVKAITVDGDQVAVEETF